MHLPTCRAVQVGTAGPLAPVFRRPTSGYEAQCSLSSKLSSGATAAVLGQVKGTEANTLLLVAQARERASKTSRHPGSLVPPNPLHLCSLVLVLVLYYRMMGDILASHEPFW